MLYKDINRLAYLEREFKSIMETITENNNTNANKIVDYVKANKVSPDEAKTMATPNMKKYVENGGTGNVLTSTLKKINSKVRNGAIAFLILASSIGTVLSTSHDSTQTDQALTRAVAGMMQGIQPNIPDKTDVMGDFMTKINQDEQQNQQQEIPEEQLIHVIKKGDALWNIAGTYKPDNVEQQAYVNKLKELNNTKVLKIGAELRLPSNEELIDIMLPDIDVKFSLDDPELIEDIKQSEGSFEGQQRIKRKLLNGVVGSPVQNNKFYPYQDSHGNWTIGYGHYISPQNDVQKAQRYANGLTQDEAEKLLKHDMERIHDDFVRVLQKAELTDLTPDAQKALYELTYNMGSGSLMKFKTMLSHLRNNDYEQAGNSLLQSAWSKQVQKSRVDRIVNLITNNESN